MCIRSVKGLLVNFVFSFEENSEENVGLVLEESEFISCEADDDETNEENSHYTSKIYTTSGTDPNRPIEVMVPNSVLHPYQVMHNPYDGKIYVITENEESFPTQTIRVNSSEEPVSKKVIHLL